MDTVKPYPRLLFLDFCETNKIEQLQRKENGNDEELKKKSSLIETNTNEKVEQARDIEETREQQSISTIDDNDHRYNIKSKIGNQNLGATKSKIIRSIQRQESKADSEYVPCIRFMCEVRKKLTLQLKRISRSVVICS